MLEYDNKAKISVLGQTTTEHVIGSLERLIWKSQSDFSASQGCIKRTEP